MSSVTKNLILLEQVYHAEARNFLLALTTTMVTPYPEFG
jgi:hypothetical protein